MNDSDTRKVERPANDEKPAQDQVPTSAENWNGR